MHNHVLVFQPCELHMLTWWLVLFFLNRSRLNQHCSEAWEIRAIWSTCKAHATYSTI